MKKFLDLITEEMQAAFTACGYDSQYAKVTLSNRPDLCEFQCNGAMPLAKTAHKAPIAIAEEVAAHLSDSTLFSQVEAVKPGFLNLRIREQKVVDYVNRMAQSDKLGMEKPEKEKTIIMDYGGPNVAKPLHIGHLRSAVIGEAIKRMGRFVGHHIVADVHLGDWGLQMGLIITELQERKPDLVYFDPEYTGEYPTEAPFTVSELEEIYPTASQKSKEDEEFKNRALDATAQLQGGRVGYQALLSHILNVSVTDMKNNYKKLDVDFDLWLGESDAQPYVPDMIDRLVKEGFAYESEGALVVDVAEESDTKEIPPCIIRKSDGASLYATTDLATLVQREKDYHPDQVLYIVDKRQDMHFKQVFRVAKKTGIVPQETELTFLGFGTMNGPDGKPFKTRNGGVMRLSELIEDINEEMYQKIIANQKEKNDGQIDEAAARETAQIVGLAALKYGDLSNQATKNYVFDLVRFTSFEGNTGPYILYTIVRMKSILRKYEAQGGTVKADAILALQNDNAKNLLLELAKFNQVMENAFAEIAPHKICSYIYDVANSLNHFYHETNIMAETDKEKQASHIALLEITRQVLETCIDTLGFSAPERM